MTLISVIIPVYNGEKTIRETIESVLAQTYHNVEVIIINDGSEDATSEIISQILDSRLKVYSYPNAGVSVSRNRGIENYSGEYIAFLDADDLWTKDKLEKQLQALQSCPEAAVVYSWTDYIDEIGNFLYPGSHLSFSQNVYQQLLIRNFIENGSNILVRREAIDKIGYFDHLLSHGEDWDFCLRLASQYNFVVVPETQVLYRISQNSASSNIFTQEQQSLEMIANTYKQAPPSLQKFQKDSLAHLYEYLTFKTLETQKSQESYRIAANFCLKMLRYKPMVIVERSRLMAITILKILLGMVLPSRYYQHLWQLLRKNK